jgi:hypothetical protein
LCRANIDAQKENVEFEVNIAEHRDIKTRVSLVLKSEGEIISESNLIRF